MDAEPRDDEPSPDVEATSLGQGEPIVPTRSLDDSDVGWGEPVPADDDDRFRRDRPPHWDAF